MTSRTVLCQSGAEAARLLKVDSKTLYRWAKEKRIAAFRSPGGQWQVFLVELNNGSGSPIYMTIAPERLAELIAGEE